MILIASKNLAKATHNEPTSGQKKNSLCFTQNIHCRANNQTKNKRKIALFVAQDFSNRETKLEFLYRKKKITTETVR